MNATTINLTNNLINGVTEFCWIIIVLSVVSVWIRITACIAYSRTRSSIDYIMLLMGKCVIDLICCFGLIGWGAIGLAEEQYCNLFFPLSNSCLALLFILRIGFTLSTAFAFFRVYVRLLCFSSSNKCKKYLYILLRGNAFLNLFAMLPLPANMDVQWIWLNYGKIVSSFICLLQTYRFIVAYAIILSHCLSLVVGKNMISPVDTVNTKRLKCLTSKAVVIILFEPLASSVFLLVDNIFKLVPSFGYQDKMTVLLCLNMTCALLFTVDVLIVAWANENFRKHFRQILISCYGIRNVTAVSTLILCSNRFNLPRIVCARLFLGSRHRQRRRPV